MPRKSGFLKSLAANFGEEAQQVLVQGASLSGTSIQNIQKVLGFHDRKEGVIPKQFSMPPNIHPRIECRLMGQGPDY